MEMSENIYANSGITAGNTSDSGDSDNSYEDIYANEDTLKTHSAESLQEPKNPVIKTETESRYYRAAALCLGLLCVLLLAIVTVLSVKFTAEKQQLQTSYNNMTKERDQLQTSYKLMTTERDQLQTSYKLMTTERDQLQSRYKLMTTERDQLQTSYKLMTTERDQLQNQIKQVTNEKGNLQSSYNDMRNQRDQLQQDKAGLQKRLANCECFRIGDRVRVKASIQTPRYEWGNASHKSVGVVTALNGENMVVNFPEHSSWNGIVSEMELVAKCD